MSQKKSLSNHLVHRDCPITGKPGLIRGGAIEPRATQIHQKPRVGQGHLPLLKAPEGGGLTVRIAVEEGDSLGNPGQYVHQGRYRGHPGDIMAPWRSRQKVDVFP